MSAILVMKFRNMEMGFLQNIARVKSHFKTGVILMEFTIAFRYNSSHMDEVFFYVEV